MEAFAPEIEWDELDKGAWIVLWLPPSDMLGHKMKGIEAGKNWHTPWAPTITAPVSGGFVSEFAVQGYQVRLVRKTRDRRIEPIMYRRKGASKTLPLYERAKIKSRLLAMAAIQEAYKIATSKEYKREYLAQES